MPHNVDMFKQCPYTGKYNCLAAVEALAATGEVVAIGAAIRAVVYGFTISAGKEGRVDLHFEGAVSDATIIGSVDTDDTTPSPFVVMLPFPMVAPTAGNDIDATLTGCDDALIVVYYNLWTP